MALDPVRFPKLHDFNITSDESWEYNCIAYVCDHADRWTWPDRFWPKGVRKELTVKVFKNLFAGHGYSACNDGTLEGGWEKVALYARDGRVTHAARQLASGRWTSKLGRWHDISHPDAQSLEGPEYGTVAAFLRRKRR
ncbi:MAG: DUF7689 domain-containing protein [Candidatus Limnocylindria bacterium]